MSSLQKENVNQDSFQLMVRKSNNRFISIDLLFDGGLLITLNWSVPTLSISIKDHFSETMYICLTGASVHSIARSLFSGVREETASATKCTVYPQGFPHQGGFNAYGFRHHKGRDAFLLCEQKSLTLGCNKQLKQSFSKMGGFDDLSISSMVLPRPFSVLFRDQRYLHREFAL